MSMPMYLAFIALVATTGGLAFEAPDEISASCSPQEGGSSCAPSELGAAEDANVMLQSQKTVEVIDSNPLQKVDLHWEVDPHKFENSMTLVTVVEKDGVIVGDGVVLAFVGGELQGFDKTSTTLPPNFPSDYAGKPEFELMVFGHGPHDTQGSDSGKKVDFKYISTGTVTPGVTHMHTLKPALAHLSDDQVDVTFVTDGHLANHTHPMKLTVIADAAPAVCNDGTQDEIDAYMLKHYPTMVFPSTSLPLRVHYTCEQLKGWNACGMFKEVCAKTCGVCP